jgi:hypothetical protein
MSVVYANALKDTRMTAVITDLDAQTANAFLEICTAAYASVLVTIGFNKPSFTEASQAITLAGVPLSNTAAATGTAALARIKDGANTVWISNLSVGVSGANDIVLNSTSITAGQTVSLANAVITHG